MPMSSAAVWLGVEPLTEKSPVPERYVDIKEHVSGYVFDISVRKADGFMLGLCCKERDTVLSVEAMQPQGAVASMNKYSGGLPLREVHPGDLIIKVNNVCGNTALMVQECLKERLVKMTLIRKSAFSFHANAPEFEPGKLWMSPRMDSKAWKVEKGPVSDASKAILRRVETLLRARLILV